jgi:hypothetical protein
MQISYRKAFFDLQLHRHHHVIHRLRSMNSNLDDIRFLDMGVKSPINNQSRHRDFITRLKHLDSFMKKKNQSETMKFLPLLFKTPCMFSLYMCFFLSIYTRALRRRRERGDPANAICAGKRA